MADYSGRKTIQHWLVNVMPVERRSQVAEALAARAILRVLPLLASGLVNSPRGSDDNFRALVLSVFRAAALSWTVAMYPAHRRGLRLAATSAVRDALAAEGAANFSSDLSGDFSVVFTTSDANEAASSPPLAFHSAAALAARSAVTAARSISYPGAHDSARIAAAAIDVAAAAVSISAGVDHTADRSITADVGALESGRSAAEIAGWPLWPLLPEGTLGWVDEAWRALKTALLSAGEDWDVWTD
jgi:hypothetical protein